MWFRWIADWVLRLLLVLAVAIVASCTHEEETVSFSVLESDECTPHQVIIIEDFDRPGAKTLANIAREQAQLAAATCPALRSLRIQHFFDGHLWYVESNSETDWMIGEWEQIPLGERERIVLDELNLMLRYLAEQRQGSGDNLQPN